MLTTLLNPTIWLLVLAAGAALSALIARRPTEWARQRVVRVAAAGVVVAAVAAAALAGVTARLVLGFQTPGDYVEDVIAARSYLASRDLYADEPRAALRTWLSPSPSTAETWALPGVTPCQAGALAQRDQFYRSQAHQPFLLILAIPLVAVVGPHGYFMVLTGLTLASILLVATGLRRAAGLRDRSRLALVLGLALLAWQPVLAALRGGTVSILVAALLFGAWRLFESGRHTSSGAAIGLAASLHPLALPLVVWLPRLSGRAFLAGAGTLATSIVITTVVAGPGVWLEFWRGAAETARTYAGAPQNYALITKGASLGASLAGAVMMVMAMLVPATALAATAPARASSNTAAVEYALAIALAALLAPVTWSPDLAVLIVPLALLFDRAWSSPTPWRLVAWTGLAVAVSLPDGPVLRLWTLLSPVVGTHGAGLLAGLPALAVLGACLWLTAVRFR
jgi:hypothetical protein